MAADGKGAADHAQVHIDLPSDDPSAKLLKDLLDEYKKVNKKPEKPVPTGIKPRGLILPTLALALLFLPVIAIFLPVFIGAGKARDDESSSRAYLCNLYQQPEPLKDARLIRDSACEDLLFDPKNGTLASKCNDAATKAAYLEAAYFDALNRNCTLVSLFQANPEADEVLYKTPEVEYWINSNFNSYVQAANGSFVPRDPNASVVTAFAKISATLSTVDVILNTAAVNFELRVDAWMDEEELPEREELFDSTTMRIKKQKSGSISMRSEVLSAAGSDGLLEIKAGDRVSSRKLDLVLTPTRSLYNYPFDQYVTTVKIDSSLGDANFVHPIAVLVSQQTALVGWTYEVSLVPNADENQVLWVDGTPELSGAQITYQINLRRTSFNQFFAVIILLGMWVISMFAFTYALDMLYIRPRNAALGDASLFTGLLFAMPNIRRVMPGIPDAIGLGVDFYGFIWIMLIMMISGSMVLCKVVGQYIHLDATLYDRLRRNQVWEDQVLRDLEAAEKKAKEEAERERERQKKREKWGIAVPPGVAAAKAPVVA